MHLIGKSDFVLQSRGELPALRFRNGAVVVPMRNLGSNLSYKALEESDIYIDFFGVGVYGTAIKKKTSINLYGTIYLVEIGLDFLDGDIVGFDEYGYSVVKDARYACFNWKNKKLYQGSYKRRMLGPIGEAASNNFAFFCKDVFCMVSMRDNSEVWSISLSENNTKGSISKALPIINNNIAIVYYSDQAGLKKICLLDLKNFRQLASFKIENELYYNSFRCLDDRLFFLDGGTLFRVDLNSADELDRLIVDGSDSIRKVCFAGGYMVVLIQDSSELVIIDRKRFEIKNRITLDIEGMKAVDLQGSDIGLAVKFKNIDDLPAEPCWVEYFSEEDLSKGVADIKAKETENWQVEKQEVGNEGKFNLLLRINEGMSGADFLRHTSHALWKTAFKYATHQNQFDKNEFRLGDKNFDGKLTLDLSAYKNLDELEEKALNRILEDAKNSMEGWGPAQPRLWVDVDTDNERPIKLEIIR